jgi:membrane protein YdbS with pleckstrin-like domain
VRWRSEWARLRHHLRRFSALVATPKATDSGPLRELFAWELDPEVEPLVLHEIGERVYAQVRHHRFHLVVAVGWLLLGALAAALLLLGTADMILLASVVTGLCLVWGVHGRSRAIVVTAAAVSGGVFLAFAGPYREHIHVLALAAILACVTRCGWLLLAYRRDLFVVTEHRVVRLWGVLFKNRAVVPLARILDITVHKPLLGRLFRYGHLVFESAAQEQGLRDVRFIPKPDAVDRIIQVLQYGGPPDPPGAAGAPNPRETPAQAESDVPDPSAEQTQPYVWGGG